ncbi:MAG: hypothetical protein SPL15_07130 [Lachnospiraceae bacterium]|nr:hypothetical protein [Lachnospiraceae bacterium]MDY5742748.1 hypothetical protein [Lachnospiraceae bacterium]
MAAEERVEKKKSGRIRLILGAFLALLILMLVTVTLVFRVTNIQIEGNVTYSDQEIKDKVFENILSYNSLFLKWKYRNRRTDIPFVSDIDISLLSPSSVKVVVYEKKLLGYVPFLDYYLYLDSDGMVAESTNQLLPSLPKLAGIQVDSFRKNEKLAAKNDTAIEQMTYIKKLLEKYKVTVDTISVDEKGYYGLDIATVHISLGEAINLEDKIGKLSSIVPSIQGQKGILHLENLTDKSDSFTLEKIED